MIAKPTRLVGNQREWQLSSRVNGVCRIDAKTVYGHVWDWFELNFKPIINWGQAQPAPLAFWNLVHTNFSVTRNLGIYNPGHEDHTDGRALDIGLKQWIAEEEKIAWGIIDNVLKPHQTEIGWSYFIWDQWIWYPDSRGQQQGGFQGNHTNHIHVSWSRDTSQRNAFPSSATALQQLAQTLSVEIQ